MRFIFVTGGVMSGIGKGITAASTGCLLKSLGISVTAIKIDPYVNVDAGTMNPYQHGEVWVTEDGGEIDLDLGHYERFLNEEIPKEHNITTGQIYQVVIEKERRGEYLGQTVQIIPHITNEIKKRFRAIAERTKVDVVIIEIGGTVGDIESEPFLEAARQIRTEEGVNNTLFIHVTLVPISQTKEQKTKPTQHSVAVLRERGIQPDVIIARCPYKLTDDSRAKIALFCNLDEKAVISGYDVDNIYKVPLIYNSEGLGGLITSRLGLKVKKEGLDEWRKIVEQMEKADKEVTIAMAGKYVEMSDSYISINEALKHAAASYGARVNISFVSTEDFESCREDKITDTMKGVDGVLVPGGFGPRGSEGKIAVIKCARERKIPYMGLCFGFQLAVVEYARNVAGFGGANSSELDPKTPHPAIDLLPAQRGIKEMGGTMRLGAQPIKIKKGTRAFEIYKHQEIILERHRHRYEVNPKYISALEEKGLVFSAVSPDGRMEILELPGHPFFMATQFHPEFKSRPGNPEPVLREFIGAAINSKYKAQKSYIIA
jgi:CTP synthase